MQSWSKEVLLSEFQKYLWIPDWLLNSPWGQGSFSTGAISAFAKVLVLATLPISQCHATETPATSAPKYGPRHAELFISRLSLGTQKTGPTTQHLSAINHSFQIGFRLWAYHTCPARWHEEYRCVLVNIFSKVRSIEAKARKMLPGPYT